MDHDHSVGKCQDEISTDPNKERSPEIELMLSKDKQPTSSEQPLVEAVGQNRSKMAESTNKYIDHGWAWMVMFGCFLMHFLVGGFARSYSLIYMYLQERFDSSAAVTAWVGGTGSAMRMLTSPVATALSNRFTARTIVMIGGIFCGFGGILSAFAPSTEYMFFSYSFFEGIGGALVYAPGIVMVGQYFDKYRSIAMGLSTAGSGFGVFCYPPVMQLMFNHYGFFGAMLVTGAVMFNNIVSGALYRPLSHVTKAKTMHDKSKQMIKDEIGSIREHDTLDEPSDYLTAVKTTGNSCANYKMSSSDKRNKKRFTMSRLYKYLDLRLFKNPTFIMYVLSLGFITSSYISGQMLVPAYAKNQGVSLENSVWLISVIGISDMSGRVASGFLFNIPLVKQHRRHYYDAAILISGLTHFMIAGTRSYVMFLVVCCMHGLFTGVVVSQRAVICTDLMGVENLSSSFGLTIFVQGTGILIGPLIAGLIKDITGSYFFSFIFTGISSLVAAIFLFGEWLIIARRRSKEISQKSDAEEIEINLQKGDSLVIPEDVVHHKYEPTDDGSNENCHCSYSKNV